MHAQPGVSRRLLNGQRRLRLTSRGIPGPGREDSGCLVGEITLEGWNRNGRWRGLDQGGGRLDIGWGPYAQRPSIGTDGLSKWRRSGCGRRRDVKGSPAPATPCLGTVGTDLLVGNLVDRLAGRTPNLHGASASYPANLELARQCRGDSRSSQPESYASVGLLGPTALVSSSGLTTTRKTAGQRLDVSRIRRIAVLDGAAVPPILKKIDSHIHVTVVFNQGGSSLEAKLR